MEIREVLIATVVAIILFAAILGGALYLLDMGFFSFRDAPAEIDCADPNSKLCQLRHFFDAKTERSAERAACIREGLPADCTDL